MCREGRSELAPARGFDLDLARLVAAKSQRQRPSGARVDLKKGGLAVVRLGAGGAQLVLLLRPTELALIAGLTVAKI